MKAEKRRKRGTIILCGSIVVVIALIKIASLHPQWIEEHYSRGFYPHLAQLYRLLFGWLPFSLGDILYTAAGVYFFVKLIRFAKLLFTRRLKKFNYKTALLKTFYILGGVYIYFNLAWGLNYNRPGIASQLQLVPQMHNVSDLELITSLLVTKVNETRMSLGDSVQFKPYKQVFAQAQDAYKSIGTTFPFLQYRHPSIKRSLYGRLGNFLGFVGYYNPFTGEAQLNLTQPRFLVPYVTCHEMAHQLGYASESEASFVGYLVAASSADTLFRYSTYFDLFNYANHELYLRDSAAAKSNFRLLDTLVRKDVGELREYWRKSENFFEPLARTFYDSYLKANQQKKGLRSYNEVVGWLIAYYKKHGKI